MKRDKEKRELISGRRECEIVAIAINESWSFVQLTEWVLMREKLVGIPRRELRFHVAFTTGSIMYKL